MIKSCRINRLPSGRYLFRFPISNKVGPGVAEKYRTDHNHDGWDTLAAITLAATSWPVSMRERMYTIITKNTTLAEYCIAVKCDAYCINFSEFSVSSGR